MWLNGGETRTFHASFPVSPVAVAGIYTVKVGFFDGGWASLSAWHNQVAQVTVADGPAAWELVEILAPATAAPGTALPVTITIDNPGATSSGLVDLELYSPAGAKIAQRAWDNIEITGGGSVVLSHDFLLAAAAPTGNYIVKLGVFGVGWGALASWYNEAATVAVAPPPPPPPQVLPLLGLLDDEVILHNASNLVGFGGDGTHGGIELLSTGDVGALGAATVVVSTSWDLAAHSAVHPCGLIEVAPRVFPVDIATGFSPIPWTATATVTVTTAGGAVSGAGGGGSLCEREALAGGGFLLEGIVSFELTGGSGDLAGASGSGQTRLIANSVTREITGNELLLRLG